MHILASGILSMKLKRLKPNPVLYYLKVMNKTVILICSIIFCYELNAQTEEIYLGNISYDMLTETSYKEDPKAEAVVLYDKGESYFKYVPNHGYKIEFTRTKRIKILNEAGLKYGQLEIPLYESANGSKESAEILQATTYNLTNSDNIDISKLQLNNVHEEKINAFWSIKKAALPKVKVGSVIEYKYILETPFLGNLPDWSFQDRIPTVYSEYKLSLIPFYEYTFAAQGITKFDYRTSETSKIDRSYGSVSKVYGQNIGTGIEFKDVIHTFVMRNVPAFRDEEYITSVNDYIQKVDFQLTKIHRPTGTTEEIMSTWENMIETLSKGSDFGKYISASERVGKKLIKEEIELNGLTDFQKTVEIINYFKSHFVWNGLQGKYASKKPKDILDNKSGNTAEINLLLIGTLKAAEINAKPVILSTRSNGKIKMEFPYDPAFNYVIPLISVGDQTFVTDATEPLIPYNRIPLKAINDVGLVVEKDANWIDLSVTPLSRNHKKLTIEIDEEDMDAKVGITIQLTEFESYYFKNQFEDDPEKLITHFEDWGLNDINEINTSNYERKNIPYVINAQASFDIGQLDNKLFFRPFINFPLNKNHLTQEERNYPVDLIYPNENVVIAFIEIPENYKVIQKPEDYQINTNLISIVLNTSQKGQVLEVMGRYTFKKAIYQPSEYQDLKNQIDLIVEKMNQNVVIEKVN
ncbi:DUF3857 domain-containing protein [Roseivirga pacifica]|nr:DUF3857 domain-containing protein [Roseivirga pacifica]MCO6368027.1 DUF3857 domain-containing protein [Roseivirga pacifica]MCO6369491.1 DUF3857 domain-containing protein [Roseivirga pacifica]MCO6377398.1 DUF3857 domain-containing protein [Roseivirga pacifica]